MPIDNEDIGQNVPGKGKFTDLSVNGAYTFPTIDGTADQVMKTDGAGGITWQDDNQLSFPYTFPSADGEDGQIIHTDGAGNLSWTDRQSGSLPVRAYPSVDKVLGSNFVDFLVFDTVSFDGNGWYDPITGKFQPTKAGYFNINTQVFLKNNVEHVQLRSTLTIMKNTDQAISINTAQTFCCEPDSSFSHSDIVFLDGSSDFVQILLNVRATNKIGASCTLLSDIEFDGRKTFFTAYKI